MSVEDGRRRFANRGRSKPSVQQLAKGKDYPALAKLGALGKGALLSMARHGDRDARATLIGLGELDPPDPNAA